MTVNIIFQTFQCQWNQWTSNSWHSTIHSGQIHSDSGTQILCLHFLGGGGASFFRHHSNITVRSTVSSRIADSSSRVFLGHTKFCSRSHLQISLKTGHVIYVPAKHVRYSLRISYFPSMDPEKHMKNDDTSGFIYDIKYQPETVTRSLKGIVTLWKFVT